MAWAKNDPRPPRDPRETTVLHDPKTQHSVPRGEYPNPEKPVEYPALDQTVRNIDRGGYSHGIVQLELDLPEKDKYDPRDQHGHYNVRPENNRTRIVTYTWQVPVVLGTPVRILPEDPDRVRAVLYVDVADLTVYLTSLYQGPQSDYGFPLVPGGEYFWVFGQNQMWGALPSNAAGNSRVSVLVERRLPDE